MLGILVAVLFVTAFSKQIMTNYKNKSTEGLSSVFMLLVGMAVSISFYLNIREWNVEAMIGNTGNITCILIIAYQIIYYKIKNKKVENK